MADRLRVGVAGAGVFGGYHANKYRMLGNVDLVSIFDIDNDRAELLAEKHDARAYTNYEAFLDSIDAVTIATPATTHFDYGLRAAHAKKSAYIEKPLAANFSDGKVLMTAFKDAGVTLLVGHQERHILDRLGLLGLSSKLISAEFVRCGPASGRCTDVSAVYDLMIHDLDFAAILGLEEPKTVNACGDADEVVSTLYFANEVKASFVASRKRDVRKRAMTLRFANCVIEVDFLECKVITDGIKRTFKESSSADLSDPLGLNVEKFISLIQNNDPVDLGDVSGKYALAMAESIETARNTFHDLNDGMERMSA